MRATTLGLLVFVLVAPPSLRALSQDVDRETYEVWLCPVHRDEQATGEGNCPVCDRDLVHRILTPSYACPMHQHVDEEAPGRCPVCNMNLVPTTRELQFYCAGRPDVVRSLPGECPDGSSTLLRSIPMAHGDHNPKHGGILFMAPNGFHHLEGTLDPDRTFRLYLYDDFTKPIDASGFRARAGDIALTPSPDGSHLSAPIGPASAYPVEVVVRVDFPDENGEARFDFIFAGAVAVEDAEVDPLVLPEFRIPATDDGIFQEILRRDARVQELIANGVWPDLYIPALEAKDLVLALAESHEGDEVAFAAKKLVRAAWLLDTYGDQGDRTKVESAYLLFEEAVVELRAAYE